METLKNMNLRGKLCACVFFFFLIVFYDFDTLLKM